MPRSEASTTTNCRLLFGSMRMGAEVKLSLSFQKASSTETGPVERLEHAEKQQSYGNYECNVYKSSVGEATLQVSLVKLHVVQPGSSLNKLPFYPWRNLVCKTTAKKSSFSNYLYSL